jgi:2-keto-3-deoxy-L-fuconate dehydrogenase
MMLVDLQGKRVLLTQSETFMGPALQRVFRALGATLTADPWPLDAPQAAAESVREAGDIDVLMAHLALPAPGTAVADVDDDEWRQGFAHLVAPLPRLASSARCSRCAVAGWRSAARCIFDGSQILLPATMKRPQLSCSSSTRYFGSRPGQTQPVESVWMLDRSREDCDGPTPPNRPGRSLVLTKTRRP